MSSTYVRQKVKGWAAALSVPFYNTVNDVVNPNDPVWTTIEWVYATSGPSTYCNNLETGTFNFYVFGAPGVGDDALLTQAEALVKALMANTDAKLKLINADPAVDFEQEHLYGAEFSISYEYSP